MKVPTQNGFTVMHDEAYPISSKNSLILYSDKQDILNKCATHIQSSLKLKVPCMEDGNILKLVLKILYILNSYRWIQISLCKPERETLRSLTI